MVPTPWQAHRLPETPPLQGTLTALDPRDHVVLAVRVATICRFEPLRLQSRAAPLGVNLWVTGPDGMNERWRRDAPVETSWRIFSQASPTRRELRLNCAEWNP